MVGFMKQKLYLNNQVSKIVGITPRQVQHWTDKAVLIAEKEASRGGDKRGYGYLNLIEACIAKSLYDKGQGIQSIKKILGRLRDRGIIKDWVNDHLGYFRNLFITGGPFFLGSLIVNKPDDFKLKEITSSIEKMLVYEPRTSKKITGTLIYFFGHPLDKHPCILPTVRLYENQEVMKDGSHFIYSFLTQYEAALLINIGQIKEDIDKALISV